ncbi:MAG: c-type cytochrome [Wenzhouxiangellaceae bacterium]|nr:c-type cytochrome [Wenzhouxiangellaceae bacterium]
MNKFKTIFKTILATLLVLVLAVLAVVFSGTYPVAVGTDHVPPFGWLLETTRERSVAVRASDLTVPGDLDAPERIAAGAGHYDSMCAGCHGRPGRDPAGVFDPAPPALSEHRVEPRAAFWTVKHGLKMTAMPSHLDHSGAENWDTVAFVRALPDMTADEYERLTAEATHDHAEGESHENEAAGDSPAGEEGEQDAAGHEHDAAAATPEAAIDGFHHALVEGRGQDALAFLHPDATIVEGGTVETPDHYAAGHMKSDIEFLGRMEIEQLERDVQIAGMQATVTTRRRMQGQLDDRQIDLVGTETATLVETDAGWRITHLAWSSTSGPDE